MDLDLQRCILFQHLHFLFTISQPESTTIVSVQFRKWSTSVSLWLGISKHTPEPPTGIFDTQLNGGSQVPENPPGPPHASPNVRAHTLQHLHGSHTMYPFPGQSSGLIMSHSSGLQTHLSAKALTSRTNKKYTINLTLVSKFDMLLSLLLKVRSFVGMESILSRFY